MIGFRSANVSDLSLGEGLTVVGEDRCFHSLGNVDYSSSFTSVLTYASSREFLAAALKRPECSVVITTPELVAALPDSASSSRTFILSSNPLKLFYEIHQVLFSHGAFYSDTRSLNCVSPLASIHPSAIIEEGVEISPSAYVGPNVLLAAGTVVEEGVRVEANAVIGIDGLEAKILGDRFMTVPHAGGVLLRKGSRIGPSCVVARALFEGYTEIGEEAQLDAGVLIAHHVKIGRRCSVAAGVVTGGAAIIGDESVVGVGAVVKGRVHIGAGSRIQMGAVVAEDVAQGETVYGHYAINRNEWFRRSVQERRMRRE